MHHDESLHATYAWYLFQGQGYHYDPVTHGPLQFFVMAFFYTMFGDSETTARLFAVLCGVALVFLPYFLRKELGQKGALLGSLFLTISPAFLYFSRFARDDVYLEFFGLIMVIAVFGLVRTHHRRYVFLLAAGAALAMATMEASYILFFILGSFGLLLVIRERLTPPGNRELTSALRSIRIEVWLYALALFLGITIVLYSSFLTNPSGIWDTRYGLMSASRQDIWGGITYWLSQHGVARGGQPWFYYLLLFGLYEQLALVLAAAGIFWAALRRHLFSSFLAYWLLLSMAIYGWAGEKMPWLLLHPLLPAILLAGMFAGRLLDASRGVLRGVAIAALVLLGLMEVHSAQALAYTDGSNPTEMLVYVQTSNDVPMVSSEVLNLVHQLPGPASQPFIQVDDSDLGGWPFQWYFRNLAPTDVQYSSDFSGATAPVLIMLGPEHDQFNSRLIRRYDVSQYRWNWWFPEDYKGLTFDDGMCGTAAAEVACAPGQTGTVFLKTGTPCPNGSTGTNCSPIQTPRAINIFKAMSTGTTWSSLWNWFAFRTPFGARGERAMYVYVRKDLVPHGAGSSGSATTPPSTQYPSLKYHAVQSFHSVPNGGLVDPRGISVTSRGRVAVADAGNHRIDVFSPAGRFVYSFGRPGSGKGEFNVSESPMDVASGAGGDLYVADWWGHRIEEFTARGRFIRDWGQYATTGNFGFYGPRSVAVGHNGDVYVADTGNRQIAVFSATGKFLFRFGQAGSGTGQFEEPSSVMTSGSGTVYVTDMWNGRVQSFDPHGHYLNSWSVDWPTDSYEEPYSAVLPNGNLLVTDPTNARLLEFSPSGKVIGQLSSPSMALPIGVATGTRGRIYVTDATNNSVTIFSPASRVQPSSTPSPTKAPKP